MKNLVMGLLFILLTITSCKEKLPSNISNILDWHISTIKDLNEIDSTILLLKNEDIKNLLEDSARILLVRKRTIDDFYDNSYKELKEILKYNPKYSDYDEFKTIPTTYLKREKVDWLVIHNKLNLLEDRQNGTSYYDENGNSKMLSEVNFKTIN